MENPFHFGRELAPGELIDREEELARIARVIAGRGRLFLIGPRRFGKTSVLAATQARAEGAGVTVLRANAQEFPSLEALTTRLISLAAERLTAPGRRVAASFAAFFPRPASEIGPGAGRFHRCGPVFLRPARTRGRCRGVQPRATPHRGQGKTCPFHGPEIRLQSTPRHHLSLAHHGGGVQIRLLGGSRGW